MRFRVPVVFLMLLLACGFLLNAQEFRATIAGHVLDSSGAAVPNVKVQAINAATNETTTGTTDTSGSYTIPFLRPGLYKVTATTQGFKTYVRDNVTLEAARTAGVDITLEVGAVTESVEVTAEAALLETQSASRGGIVNEQQITEIPLNARNPFMLGSMMPGVNFNGAAIWQRPFDNGAIAEWSINGSRTFRNEFLLDGVPNNAQAGGNNIAYVPIVDAVQEFNVQTNSYNAEYGHTGGGIFNVVLKSGGSEFHGTAWEFLRRTGLDANRFQSNAVGAKRTTHYLDQYGFQLTGPLVIPKLLKKDGKVKLFFLGSYEGYREGTPTPLTMSYPEPEMRNGDFSKLVTGTGAPIAIYDPFNTTKDANGDPIRKQFAGNIIPTNLINPVAKAVSKYMPMPNTKASGLRYSNSNVIYPDYFAKDSYYNLILKFDWNFGDKHRAFVRHGSNDRTEDRNDNGVFEGPGQSGQQPFQRINDAYVVDWVSTLTPTVIVNFRLGYNRFIEKGWGRGNEGFDLTSLGLPSSLISTLPGPTYFGRWCQDNGYSCLGRYQGINITNGYSLNGNITKIWNKHTIKAGVDLRQIHYITQDSGNILEFQGNTRWTQRLYNVGETNSGDGYASFLLGVSGGVSNYPLYPFWKNWYFAPYIQDSWKISRRLTLDLGLRWDYNQLPAEKWNRMNGPMDMNAASPISGMIDPKWFVDYPQLKNLKGAMTFAGVGGISSRPINTYKNTFQPRFGFAYSLTDRLVMRGGVGEYFMNPGNESLKTQGFSTSTDMVTSNDGNRTPIPGLLSNPYPFGINRPSGSSLGALSYVGRNPSWYNPDFKLPNIWQFSYGFQFQVTKTSTLDFSYVGSRTYNGEMDMGSNLQSLADRKKCNPLEGGSVAYCDAGLPNPFKGIEAFKGQGFYTANTISRWQLARPMPQFNGSVNRQGRNESEIYFNALEVTYNMRFRNGLNLMGNYTLGKQIEKWGWTDDIGGVRQQGLYFLDHPHAAKLTVVYDLPFGRGKKFGGNAGGMLDRIIGGWEVTSFYTNMTGNPADLPGNVIQLKDPQKGYESPDWKAYQVRGWSPCVLRWNNNGTVAPQPYSIQKGCGTDWSNYAWLQLPGYAPRSTPSRSGQIRRHSAFTMDASLLKMTNITERIKVQFGFEAFNLMNHNYYGRETFNTDPNSENFGTIFPHLASTQNIFPRQIQIRLKAYW